MDKQLEKKYWTVKRIGIIGIPAAIVLFVLISIVFGDRRTALNVQKERLTLSTVTRGLFQDYIPVTGEVLPNETFFLDVVEGGRIIQKYVEEGAYLKVGNPIIKLENANLSLQMIYNQTQVVQQENNLRTFKLTLEQNRLSLQTQILNWNIQIQNQRRIYETSKKLSEKNMISQNEFDNSRDQYEYLVRSRDLCIQSYKLDSLSREGQIKQLEVTVKQFQTNMKLIEDQFSNLTVRAPIDGQLTALNAEIGKSIAPGQNIGQIDDTITSKVRVDVDEHYIARIRDGQIGEWALDDHLYKLRVRKVYVQVTNGRFQADMNFIGDAPKGIRRGQTVHIKLELGGSTTAVLIETGGFYSTTGGQWIFVIDKSGTFAVKRQIRIGRQNPQYYEVLEGLSVGEKVITSSYETFGDKEKLILQ